jgi:hypothetical protein
MVVANRKWTLKNRNEVRVLLDAFWTFFGSRNLGAGSVYADLFAGSLIPLASFL